MPDRRTELRDELAILIAAGRELTPDHDQALADVFVDRLVKTRRKPSVPWRFAAGVRRPRRLIGAAVLGLAVLGLGSAATILDTSASGSTSSSVPTHVLVAPKMPKAPLVFPPKIAHAVPAPKAQAGP